MSAFCLFNQINSAFLFSGDRIPRTLSERSGLKFTFSLLLANIKSMCHKNEFLSKR